MDRNWQAGNQSGANRPSPGDDICDFTGSPGSLSNSSSSRQHRIVELLGADNNDGQPSAWVISPEFYSEDLVPNPDNMSADSTDNEEEDNGDEQDVNFHGFGLMDLFDDRYEEHDAIEYGNNTDEEETDSDDLLDGYVIARGEDDEDEDDDDNDDDDDDSSTDIEDDSGEDDEGPSYDTTLPLDHRYLGDNLEESRGQRILVENCIISLPLINLKRVVLFPGQQLPVTTAHLNPRIEIYLRRCITDGSTTIGLMSDCINTRIGTTAEIRNYSLNDNELRVILLGRQKFRLLSGAFETATTGEVEILPEVTLGSPYPQTINLERFYEDIRTPNEAIISKHPAWLLKLYVAQNLMQRIRVQIEDWFETSVSSQPDEFSYWVASNLPISDVERLQILSFGCAEARLSWLLNRLESFEYFGCYSCKNPICHKKNVFPMSRSGPQCSFVNPYGCIHDTLTVRKALGLSLRGGWSAEYSWFPGYAWKLANCANCERHIGWCYLRVKGQLKPRRFFGLSRSNLRLLPTTETGRQVVAASPAPQEGGSADD